MTPSSGRDAGEEARAAGPCPPRDDRGGCHHNSYRDTIYMVAADLTDADYELLLEFRTGLRRFLRWSEEQAVAVGLTPISTSSCSRSGATAINGPTIGEIADALLLRHHSAVGLIDRAEAAGLVRRQADREDQRVVRLRLTPLGLAASASSASATSKSSHAPCPPRAHPEQQRVTRGTARRDQILTAPRVRRSRRTACVGSHLAP